MLRGYDCGRRTSCQAGTVSAAHDIARADIRDEKRGDCQGDDGRSRGQRLLVHQQVDDPDLDEEGGEHDGLEHEQQYAAKRLQAEKKAGRSGWAAIRWRQRLYEDMGIELARANYRMLMERTLPPRVGG